MLDDLLLDSVLHITVVLLLSFSIAHFPGLDVLIIVDSLSPVLFLVTNSGWLPPLLVLECLINFELRSRTRCIVVKCLALILVKSYHGRVTLPIHLVHHLLHTHGLLNIKLALKVNLVIVPLQVAVNFLYFILGSIATIHILLFHSSFSPL